jgi:futalosine hydrolase
VDSYILSYQLSTGLRAIASTSSFGSGILLLFPTELEKRSFESHGVLPSSLAVSELCGFGPVAAAARTAELLGARKPARVLLVGVAGAYDTREHPVGDAFEFDEVAIDGIGVGEGRSLVSARALGFPQWPGTTALGHGPIFDRLPLSVHRVDSHHRLLLTACAASADRRQARWRKELFPDAIAEDMEGFAVATACAITGVPLRVVRGISNEVGDRAYERWRIPAALESARRRVIDLLESGAGWESP